MTRVGQLRRDLAEHEYEIQCLKAELGEALSPLGGEGYAAAAAAESETRLAATLAAGAAERSAQDEFRARVTQMPETLVHLPRAVEGAQHAAEVASVRTAQHAADEGRRQLASDIYCHSLMRQHILSGGTAGPANPTEEAWAGSREGRALRVAEALSRAGDRIAQTSAAAAAAAAAPAAASVRFADPLAEDAVAASPDDFDDGAAAAAVAASVAVSLSPVPLSPPAPATPPVRFDPGMYSPIQDAEQRTIGVGNGSLLEALAPDGNYHRAVVTYVADEGGAVDVEWSNEGGGAAAAGEATTRVPVEHTRVVVPMSEALAAATAAAAAEAQLEAERHAAAVRAAEGLVISQMAEEEACRLAGFAEQEAHIAARERRALSPELHSPQPRLTSTPAGADDWASRVPELPSAPRTPKRAVLKVRRSGGGGGGGDGEAFKTPSRRVLEEQARLALTAAHAASPGAGSPGSTGRKRSYSTTVHVEQGGDRRTDGLQVREGVGETEDTWKHSLRTNHVGRKKARRSGAMLPQTTDTSGAFVREKPRRVLSLSRTQQQREYEALFGSIQKGSQFAAAASTAPRVPTERKFLAPKGWGRDAYPLADEKAGRNPRTQHKTLSVRELAERTRHH